MKTFRTRPTSEESAHKASTETVKEAFAKSGTLPHRFTVNIGDWSDDGHGKTEEYVFGCNKPMKAVVSAFKKACKKFPRETHPTSIFSDYEEHSLTPKAYFEIFDAGYDMLHGFNEPKERARREKDLPDESWEDMLRYPQVDKEELALYILWFCQQGDASLVFSKETADKLFGFFGMTDQAGYGLFN